MRTARGYSLVELVVAAGIGLSLMGAVGMFIVQGATVQTQSWAIVEVNSLRQNIFDSLASDTAWKNTLDNPSNASAVACLTNGTECDPSGTGAPFAIFDSADRLVFDATNPAHGFTDKGDLCKTFSTSSENGSCTNRFDLKWNRNCLPGDCTNSLTKITAVFRANWEAQRNPINRNRLSLLSFYREIPQVILPPPPIPAPPIPAPPSPPPPSCWSQVYTEMRCSGWIYDNHMAGNCSWGVGNCGVSHTPFSPCTSITSNVMNSATCSGGCCTFLFQNCSPGECP